MTIVEKQSNTVPKIPIFLSLRIFDRVNEIKIRFFEVTPHKYVIPKWYAAVGVIWAA